MEPPAGVPHRVYLHVGAPKTGTTFLQQVLFDHRDLLAEHGVLYPADTYDQHFFAALDLQDLAFNEERRPEADGQWERVAFRARGWPGTSVISHDVLAGATAEQARAAIAALAPAEVHVVYTVRDLARQLPSHWQEDVKHGETAGFADWMDACWRHDDSTWNRPWFWAVEDVPSVLGRWGATLPSAQVHVVTVPPEGSDPGLLWRRFASVVGLQDVPVDLERPWHTNAGLTRTDVALLRRVNEQRRAMMPQHEYERVVKGVWAHEILAAGAGRGRAADRRLRLPADRLDQVRLLAAHWTAEIEAAGYDVVGDLAELSPRAGQTDVRDLDVVDDADLLEAAVASVRALLVRVRDEQGRLGAVSAHRDDLARQVEELGWRLSVAEWAVEEHRSLGHLERVKRTVVEIGRTSDLVTRLLNVYRRARRRPTAPLPSAARRSEAVEADDRRALPPGD